MIALIYNLLNMKMTTVRFLNTKKYLRKKLSRFVDETDLSVVNLSKDPYFCHPLIKF